MKQDSLIILSSILSSQRGLKYLEVNNVNSKKIKEFMLFEDDSGKMGTIIKDYVDPNSWLKCYKDGNISGEMFDEKEGDKNFDKIIKLYRLKNNKSNNFDKALFYAMGFMTSGDLTDYECVYDVSKNHEAQNIVINLTFDGTYDINKIVEEINNELKNNKYIINKEIC